MLPFVIFPGASIFSYCCVDCWCRWDPTDLISFLVFFIALCCAGWLCHLASRSSWFNSHLQRLLSVRLCVAFLWVLQLLLAELNRLIGESNTFCFCVFISASMLTDETGIGSHVFTSSAFFFWIASPPFL